MATYNKIEDFPAWLLKGQVNVAAAGDTLKCFLMAAAQSPSVDDLEYINSATPGANQLTDATITNQDGYTLTGEDIQNDMAETGAGTGVWACTAVDVVWTATATGTIGAFQYVGVYDDSLATTGGDYVDDGMICWWDYGSTLSISNSSTFTVDFTNNRLFTISAA